MPKSFKLSPAVPLAAVYDRPSVSLPVRTPRKVGTLVLPDSAVAAGWQWAVGDAARDKLAHTARAVFMLCPATVRYYTAPPLFRCRIGKRSAVFEVRAHDANRCTSGRWLVLDRDALPRGARALATRLKWYAEQAAEYLAKRDAFRFADHASRDRNRCATAPLIPNAPAPRPSGGSRGGSGPKGRSSHVATFGHAPASGTACATHAPTHCPQCGNPNAR